MGLWRKKISNVPTYSYPLRRKIYSAGGAFTWGNLISSASPDCCCQCSQCEVDTTPTATYVVTISGLTTAPSTPSYCVPPVTNGICGVEALNGTYVLARDPVNKCKWVIVLGETGPCGSIGTGGIGQFIQFTFTPTTFEVWLYMQNAGSITWGHYWPDQYNRDCTLGGGYTFASSESTNPTACAKVTIVGGFAETVGTCQLTYVP